MAAPCREKLYYYTREKLNDYIENILLRYKHIGPKWLHPVERNYIIILERKCMIHTHAHAHANTHTTHTGPTQAAWPTRHSAPEFVEYPPVYTLEN